MTPPSVGGGAATSRRFYATSHLQPQRPGTAAPGSHTPLTFGGASLYSTQLRGTHRGDVETPVLTPRMERLRACWHGVAYSPPWAPRRTHAAARRADRIWRDSRGTPRVPRSVHPSRDCAVARVVAGDEIVCAYHGWRYAADGRCTAIPQLDDPHGVPAKARATAYRCQERYGVMWVAIDEPRWPIPDLPDLESPGWRTVPCGPYAWNSEASRQIENFTDLGALPVGPSRVAGQPQPGDGGAPEVRTEGTSSSTSSSAGSEEHARPTPSSPTRTARTRVRRTRYQLHLPYTIVVHMDWGGREKLLYCSCPSRSRRIAASATA